MWYICDFESNRSINTCLWYCKLSYRRDLFAIYIKLKQKKTFSYNLQYQLLTFILPLRLHCHVMLYLLIHEKNMLEECRIKLKTYELAT